MAALTPKAGSVTGAVPGSAPAVAPTGDDLDVAKAQLGLDQEELADSMEDLARASGDHRGKIQQELAAREAEMKKYDEQAAAGRRTDRCNLSRPVQDPGGADLRVVGTAQQDATDRPGRAAGEGGCRCTDRGPCTAGAGGQAAEAKAAAVKAAGESSSTRVKDLQSLATQRNILSILDDRLGAQQQLVTLYVRWGNQVELQHKILLHLILRSLTWIATLFC